jgi:hypothetical protein
MTTVGEGICQFDNTTRPAAESPASIKTIIEIRVMSFPYPLSHFGPLILASVLASVLAKLVLTHAILADSNRNFVHPKDERLKTTIKSHT